MSEKKTIGTLVNQVNAGIDGYYYESYYDYKRQNADDLLSAIAETVSIHKNFPLHLNKDFYVVISHIIDAALKKPVNKIMTRDSCPTPVYKQSVYKYHNAGGNLEFLWSLPTKEKVAKVVANPGNYLFEKDTGAAAKMCLLYHSGKLTEWAKKQNGNKIDNVVLKIKKEEENG